MEKFEIVTEDLLSAAKSIDNTANSLDEIAASFKKLDCENTDPEEDFDFEAVQSKIASNLKSASDKMKNGGDVLRQVVEQHTEFQKTTFNAETNYGKTKLTGGTTNSDKADGEESKEEQDQSSSNDNSAGTTEQSTGPVLTSPAPIPSSTHSSTHSSTQSSKTNNTKSTTKDKTDDGDEPAEEYTGLEKEVISSEEGIKQETDNTGEEGTSQGTDNISEEKAEPHEISNFSGVNYAYVKDNLTTEESKTIINNSTYDTSGYLKMNDRYVIACDQNVAKVGDVISFTSQEGQSTECLVGINTYSEQLTNSVHFLVNRESWNNNPQIDNILTNSVKIENIGNFSSLNNNETDSTISEVK